MTKRYRRREDAVSADLGEEMAVLNLESGSYLGFNATAAHAWRLLEAPRSIESLCESMTTEFDVAPEQCRQALGKLLAKLEANGLVIAVDQ
jgi:hypothetical protein